MTLHTGSCLCGGVRFTLTAPIESIQVCHCGQCRKAQGTALATNAPVARSAFSLDAGDALLSAYESSPGKRRVFCRVCGSPVYSERDTLPGVLRIRLGLINGDIEAPLEAHCHVADKANWWPLLDDGAPRFPGGSDASPSVK